MKWRSAPRVLCDCRIPIKLKGKFYKTVIRPVLLYGIKCWAVKRKNIQKMSVVEMIMLRCIRRNRRKVNIWNEERSS